MVTSIDYVYASMSCLDKFDVLKRTCYLHIEYLKIRLINITHAQYFRFRCRHQCGTCLRFTTC